MQGRQQGPKAPLPQANSVQNSWKQSSNCLHELPEMHSRVHTNSHKPSTSHACMHTRNARRQLKCLLIVCRAPKDQLSAGDGDAPWGDMHTPNTLSRSEPCSAAAGENALHTALHCRSRLLTVVNTAQHSTTTPQERQISRTARNTTILLHTPAHTSFTAFSNPPIQFWRDKPQAEQGRASRQQPCTTNASMQDHEYRLLGRKAMKEWTALHTHHLPCHTPQPKQRRSLRRTACRTNAPLPQDVPYFRTICTIPASEVWPTTTGATACLQSLAHCTCICAGAVAERCRQTPMRLRPQLQRRARRRPGANAAGPWHLTAAPSAMGARGPLAR